MAEQDADPPAVDRLLGDVREALELLGEVEAAALGVARVLVLDDDERLGELTARGLRRQGCDAEASSRLRPLRSGELVVVDLGLVAGLDEEERRFLGQARPIVVTGAADAASRALAADLGATDYFLKPVDVEELMAAIKRRLNAGS